MDNATYIMAVVMNGVFKKFKHISLREAEEAARKYKEQHPQAQCWVNRIDLVDPTQEWINDIERDRLSGWTDGDLFEDEEGFLR